MIDIQCPKSDFNNASKEPNNFDRLNVKFI